MGEIVRKFFNSYQNISLKAAKKAKWFHEQHNSPGLGYSFKLNDRNKWVRHLDLTGFPLAAKAVFSPNAAENDRATKLIFCVFETNHRHYGKSERLHCISQADWVRLANCLEFLIEILPAVEPLVYQQDLRNQMLWSMNAYHSHHYYDDITGALRWHIKLDSARRDKDRPTYHSGNMQRWGTAQHDLHNNFITPITGAEPDYMFLYKFLCDIEYEYQR